jgi:hypothetical protein
MANPTRFPSSRMRKIAGRQVREAVGEAVNGLRKARARRHGARRGPTAFRTRRRVMAEALRRVGLSVMASLRHDQVPDPHQVYTARAKVNAHLLVIARGKSNRRLAHTPAALQACASRDARGVRRPTSIAGTPAGPTLVCTAPPSARFAVMFAEERPDCGRSLSSRFRYFQFEHAHGPSRRLPSKVEYAYYSPRRRAGSAGTSRPMGRRARPLAPSHDGRAGARAPPPGAMAPPRSTLRIARMRTPPTTLTLRGRVETTPPAPTSGSSALRHDPIAETAHSGSADVLGVLGLVKQHGPAAVGVPAPPRWTAGR